MHIKYTTPSGKTEEFKTKSKIVIVGRLKSQQPDYLSLKDGRVSAHHTKLSVKDGVSWIEDLDSTNGTWVNSKRITKKTRLGPESVIRVGGTILKLEMDKSKASPPPPEDKKKKPESQKIPESKPVEMVSAEESLPDLFLPEAAPKASRQRLSVFCDLTASLGEIDTIEGLAASLLQHLHKAFPRKGRKLHSGLLLGDDLVLKAFFPENKPPTSSLTLARYVLGKKQACLWYEDEKTEVKQSASLMQHKIDSAMYAPLIWKEEILGVIYIDAASSKAPFTKEDLRLIQAIATQAAMFIKNLSLQQSLQREAVVKARLLAQFPPKIAERLAKNPSRVSGVNERVEKVCVLISDVRKFTKLSAKMEPEQVVQMLNDMFYDLTPIVLKYNGTVDKYVGDAILAVFGSPDPDEQQWEHAVQAALEMQEAMARLGTSRWKRRQAFEIGIGIHTGPVIHGFIGAPERMEYTVIGDTINCASRYCDAAAPNEILISPAVYERLHRRVEVDHPARDIDTKHEGKLKAYVVRNLKD